MLEKLQRQPRLVLIDLDGTLVDSVPDLAHCVDMMMTELSLAPRGEAAVREWIGNGVPVLVRRALTGTLDGEADATLYEKALKIFLDLYRQNVCVYSRLYPGVQEGLDYLQKAGYKLGCVTNKAAAFTEPLLEKLGVKDYFKVIISGDTLDKKKPDPAPLFYGAEKLAEKPENALMIGDSMHDVDAARAAGFQVICVSYGYNHGIDIREANPDAVIDSFTELEALLAVAAI